MNVFNINFNLKARTQQLNFSDKSVFQLSIDFYKTYLNIASFPSHIYPGMYDHY